MTINDEQMACLYCGHIAAINDIYETEQKGEKEFPICPKCGGRRIAGYPSYKAWGQWGEIHKK